MKSETSAVGKPSFGAATFDLLRRLTLRVGVRYRYPPPPGFDRWESAAADEWLMAVFLPQKGTETVVALQISADSENSLIAQLTTTVRNVFRSEARATVVGRLMGRLDTLLGADERFAPADQLTGGLKSWTLPELGEARFGGDWSDLVRAPALHGLPVLGVLNEQGPTSNANARALKTAALATLREARGAVRAADLARVLTTIYELEDPDVAELDDLFDSAESITAASALQPGQALERAEAAQAIFDQLDPVEIELLPHLDKSVASIRKDLPNISAPARRLTALRAKLQIVLVEYTEPETVIGELLDLADQAVMRHHAD